MRFSFVPISLCALMALLVGHLTASENSVDFPVSGPMTPEVAYRLERGQGSLRILLAVEGFD
ncbi:MAG: hypothetical protein ACQKBT_10480, partial [Puniceicoccales bacterium]